MRTYWLLASGLMILLTVPMTSAIDSRLNQSMGLKHNRVAPVFGVRTQDVPWSLEQLFLPHGLGFHVDRAQTPFIPATVQIHHLWLEYQHDNLTLPCWSAMKYLQNSRKSTSFHRHWYVGQGSAEQLKPVTLYGYSVERSSGSLLLDSKTIRRNQHFVFTCVLTSPLAFVSGWVESHSVIIHEALQITAPSEPCDRLVVPIFCRFDTESDEMYAEEELESIDKTMLPHTAVQGWCPHRWRDQTIGQENHYLDAFDLGTHVIGHVASPTFPSVQQIRQEPSKSASTVSMASISYHRRCAIGFFLADSDLSIDTKQTKGTKSNHQCSPCPENHFADVQTSDRGCERCPRHRPSTNGMIGAVSTQCSSPMLNKIRTNAMIQPIARRRTSIQATKGSSSIQFDPEIFTSQDTLDDILEHLKPSNEWMHDQQQAIELILKLTYLGFSDSEILLMLMISICMAIYGFLLTVTLFFGILEPLHWTDTGQSTVEPNRIQQLILPIFSKFCRIAELCFCLPLALCNRRLRNDLVTLKFTRIRQSRLSRMVVSLVRETLNVYRQQMLWDQLMDMRRYNRLKDLLTELTVHRVVEAAELALLVQSSRTIASEFVTFDERLKFKRSTAIVLRPYLRLPKHYDTTYFLLHPEFWSRLHQFRSLYPAPVYPLDV